jgi:uncharacterized protein
VGAETLIAGVLIVVGVLGVLVPVLPGLLLVLAGIAIWAVPRGDAVGWTVLGIAALIVALGSVAKYLLPGRKLREAGVPFRTLALGGVLGAVGFFVIPVIGLFLGFLLGVYVGELGRLGDRSQAWPATRRALGAVGWSMLIELTTGLLAAAVWIGGLVLG